MQPKYREQGVQVLGFICFSSEQFARDFVQRYRLTYPMALDLDGRFKNRFCDWLPITVLVDKEGLFRWAASGFFPKLIEPALDAILAGQEPPTPRIRRPEPQDLEAVTVQTTQEGDLFVSVVLRREDYRIVDVRLESTPGQAASCRNDLPIWEQWEQGRCTQTWWLVPLEPPGAEREQTGPMRLIWMLRQVDTPSWGTHLPRPEEVTLPISPSRPPVASAVEFIALQLGELPCGEKEAKPADRLFASHVRFHAARARWLHWWLQGERIKTAEAGEKMVEEPYFAQVGMDNISPWYMKVADAFAAAGEEGRARKYYQLALNAAKTEEGKRAAQERLDAMNTQPQEKWQAAALQRTAPPRD